MTPGGYSPRWIRRARAVAQRGGLAVVYIATVQRPREIAENVVRRGVRELARVLRGECRHVVRAGNGDGDRLRDKTAKWSLTVACRSAIAFRGPRGNRELVVGDVVGPVHRTNVVGIATGRRHASARLQGHVAPLRSADNAVPFAAFVGIAGERRGYSRPVVEIEVRKGDAAASMVQRVASASQFGKRRHCSRQRSARRWRRSR